MARRASRLPLDLCSLFVATDVHLSAEELDTQVMTLVLKAGRWQEVVLGALSNGNVCALILIALWMHRKEREKG